MALVQYKKKCVQSRLLAVQAKLLKCNSKLPLFILPLFNLKVTAAVSGQTEAASRCGTIHRSRVSTRSLFKVAPANRVELPLCCCDSGVCGSFGISTYFPSIVQVFKINHIYMVTYIALERLCYDNSSDSMLTMLTMLTMLADGSMLLQSSQINTQFRRIVL